MEKLPHLTGLKSLKLDEDLEPGVLQQLLRAYSGQLERLRLSATSLHTWRSKEGLCCFRWQLNFPQLTELEIYHLSEEHIKSIWRIIGVFWNMPSLVRLQLSQSQSTSYWGPKLYSMDDLFPLIEKKFPRLQSFISAGSGWTADLQERPLAHVEMSSSISASLKCTSLTFLRVEDCGRFSYKFLRQLPNLEYLHIRSMSDSVTVIDHSNDPFVVTMKESMHSGLLYRSPIWEALPRLKEIGIRLVECEGPRRTGIFHRNVYDKMRLTGNWTILQPGDCQPLREDILEFLKMRAEDYEEWPYPDHVSQTSTTDHQPTATESDDVYEIDNLDDLSDDNYSEMDEYDEDEYMENSMSDIESSGDFTSESEGEDRD